MLHLHQNSFLSKNKEVDHSVIERIKETNAQKINLTK